MPGESDIRVFHAAKTALKSAKKRKKGHESAPPLDKRARSRSMQEKEG
jgi:hypothetical protein